MKKNPLNKNNSSKKPFDAYAKYSGIAFKMGITIFIGVYGGLKLDAYFETQKAYFTAALALIFTLIAVYSVIKDVTKH